MRTVQPCFLKFKYCHIKPTNEAIDLPNLLALMFANLGFSLSTLYIMPPFVPNQWMLDNHGDKGLYDWEIYAWCVHDAIAKTGRLEKSEITNRDRCRYYEMMNKRADSFEYKGQVYYTPDTKPSTSINDDFEKPLL